MNSGDGIRVVHPLFQEEGDGSIPISPLQLSINEIHLTQAIPLNELWHSRLPTANQENMQRVKHQMCFAADYKNRFYAVAIWTDPIARLLNGLGWLELRRLAIADDAPKNTASRMLRIMRQKILRKWPHIEKLISYQDTGVHAGTIYKAAGWQPTQKNMDGGWNRPNRARTAPQAPTPKIRWEYELAT